MAKVHPPLTSFNRGEVSPLALARVDVDRLRLSAECQVNWLPHVLGPMMIRPGTAYVGSTKSDAAARIIPFIFSNTDKRLLEFTDSLLRIWSSDSLVTRASVTATVTNGTFASGVGWTLANTSGCTADINSTVSGALYLAAISRGGVTSCLRSVAITETSTAHAFRVVVTRGPVTFMIGTTSGGTELLGRTVLNTGTHSLVVTPGAATVYVKFENTNRRACIVDSITVESSGTLELTIPYVAADLSKIRYAQSGDVVWLACDGYQQRRIERRNNDSWSIILYESDSGPFTVIDTNSVTLTPSVYEGNGTLTASKPMFTSADVGKLFRIFHGGQTKKATLGAVDAVTESLRVTGAGTADRNFSWVLAGTWVGTIALERSTESADVNFKEFDTDTANGANGVNDTADHDNIVSWYRARFKTYTSGNVQVSFSDVSLRQGPSTPKGAVLTGGTAGICRVTAYTSATVVDMEVLSPFSEIISSDNWEPGDWNATDGYPSAVTLFDGRLWWAGRDRVWGSESDNFTGFDIFREGDSAGISRSVGTGPIDNINWILPLTRLILGREGSECSVRSSAFDEPLTPTNFTLKDCSTLGSKALPALRIDTRGIFVEKSGRRVYELAYNVEIQDYRPLDLTRLNPKIGVDGFVDIALQRQPDTVIHLVTGLGQVAVLVRDAGIDDVTAWWRFQTDGFVENVAVLPGTLEDQVYYVVKHTINGSTKRYIEKMARRDEAVGGTSCKIMDCHLVVSQASSTTVTGLSHLEGKTVVVWGNSKDLGSYTVSSASITLSEAVTSCIVGLGGSSTSVANSSPANTMTVSGYNGVPGTVFADDRYVGTIAPSAGTLTLPNGLLAYNVIAYFGLAAPFMSAKLAYGAQMGTALSQTKKIDHLGLILLDTHYQGITQGQSHNGTMDPLRAIRKHEAVASDTVYAQYDDVMAPVPGRWDTDGRLCLLAQSPRPACVMAAVIGMDTKELG